MIALAAIAILVVALCWADLTMARRQEREERAECDRSLARLRAELDRHDNPDYHQ